MKLYEICDRILYEICDRILYDKTHSGIWVINIRKRYENKVYLNGLILKIRHIF